jgi:sortase A
MARKKSDILLILIVILLFVVGAGVMVYPDLASWLASRDHAGLVEQYQRAIDVLSVEEITEHFEQARKFNESLIGGVIEDPFVQGSGFVVPSGYYDILNVSYAMGAVEIPTIDVSIPIFHGTGEDVLMRGIGHIPVSPFPVGQKGKHAVLTGHTGIPTSRLFTDLELLEIGDIFIVSVLDERMAYQVDEIHVVLPNEVNSLRNIPDQDLVTLVTCTPYAINSHRLLVRGHRVPYVENMEIEIGMVVTNLNWRILLIIGISSLYLLGWLLYAVKNRKRKRSFRRAT